MVAGNATTVSRQGSGPGSLPPSPHAGAARRLTMQKNARRAERGSIGGLSQNWAIFPGVETSLLLKPTCASGRTLQIPYDDAQARIGNRRVGKMSGYEALVHYRTTVTNPASLAIRATLPYRSNAT